MREEEKRESQCVKVRDERTRRMRGKIGSKVRGFVRHKAQEKLVRKEMEAEPWMKVGRMTDERHKDERWGYWQEELNGEGKTLKKKEKKEKKTIERCIKMRDWVT